VTARRNGQKPGFLGFTQRSSETGFFAKILGDSPQKRSKTRFLGFYAKVIRNRVFYQNTWWQPAETVKNPVMKQYRSV